MLTAIREYWERKWWLLSIVLIITLSSPFLGIALAGWPGVIVGLVVSIFSLFAGFLAVTRVREMTTRDQ